MPTDRRSPRLLLVVAAAISMTAALAVAGCGPAVGSCVGTGGIVDSCKEGWTEEECADWNDQGVNGSTWTFSKASCEENGYSAVCSDGTHVRSSSDC